MPRPRRSSGSRRQTTWVGPPAQGYVTVASTAKTLVGSFDPEASFMVAPTIVRTRGMVSFRLSSFAADLAIVGAVGVGVVSDRAFAAGAASIPGPFTDASWGGWLAWRSFAFNFDVTTDVGRLLASWTLEMDSKAMRKIAIDETIVLMAESQQGALEVAMPLRLLMKLS